jgi:hypothetical protein
MERQRAIIFALALGVMTALGTAPAVGAQEHLHAREHAGAQPSTGAAMMADVRQQSGDVRLNVASLNNSGVTGVVNLRPIDQNRVRVEVQVRGGDVGQLPIHIHEGTCADLNPTPKIPFTTVASGTSVTELDGSFQQWTSAPHVIFMHKSPQELPIFVACADISAVNQVTALPSTGEPDHFVELAGGLAASGFALAAAGYALRRRVRRARV